MPKDAHLLNLLEKALNSQYGIEVQASSPRTIQQYLWNARRRWRENNGGDSRYDGLIVRVSPNDPDNMVWVIQHTELKKLAGEEECHED